MIAMGQDRQQLSEDAGPVQSPRLAFIRWQCRARQIAVRNRGGKPDDSIMPQLVFGDLKRPSHGIITIMCRNPEFSVLPELAQIAKSTHDPAIRRESAVRFFSAGYYQSAAEFSGSLAASFPPGSLLAEALISSGQCGLIFDSFAQRYELQCSIHLLGRHDPLRSELWWHNFLFNPGLRPETAFLVFDPDWENCSAGPSRNLM